MSKLTALARHTSSAQEDYLKALYGLGAVEAAVPPSRLARELDVSPASVTDMLAKLAVLGLVTHDRAHGARLTPTGRGVALEMVRHHRLLEAYLVQALGYRWDEVHDEADRLEHCISEGLEQRMFQALGGPSFDPHGDPIPSTRGSLPREHDRCLLACKAGDRVRLSRVSDREPEKLRALRALGLELGTAFEVVGESRWEGPLELRLNQRLVQVPLGLARIAFVH